MKPETLRIGYSHNILPAIAMSLIVCYYAFDSIEKPTFAHNINSEIKSELALDEFEINVQKLRAALVLKSDIVELNGMLFQVEKSLERLGLNNRLVEISNIQAMISAGNTAESIEMITNLHGSVLKNQNTKN